jgi:hypothetical protein
MGAKQALHELLGAHFQAVNGDWFPGFDRNMLGDVHGEGCLPH